MRIREYAIAPLILLVAACAPVTAQIDDATGTTLAERCETRRAAVAAYDTIALSRELTETESNLRLYYQVSIDSVCPAL